MFSRGNRIRRAALVSLIFILILCVFARINKTRETAMTTPATELSVLMYHHVLKDSSYWGKYVISPSEFEQDLQFLQNNGYTVVRLQDVVDFVQKGRALPDKAVLLTFDDGYLSFDTYITPLLEKYNASAVLSVIGSYSDDYTNNHDTNPAYAHVTWQDVKRMAESGRVEIANHSYKMHETNERRGTMRRAGESEEAYQQTFLKDEERNRELIQAAIGYRPICYTYPFGFISPESIPVLKEAKYLVTLSCTEGINYLTGAPEELFGLKRFNRPHGKSAAVILGKK
ncbi:MAG: polysaccharide deacetylase [Ruminococcaceae bacterium]|nr:polysaccharide deacetylase [Oscillospiraceae bacterium]